MTGRLVISEIGKSVNSIAVPLFVILVVVLLAAGCTGKTEYQIIPKDKYVFLEHHIKEDGIKINGSYCSPRLNIDFPMYSFDIHSKKLSISSIYREKYVNDSLLLVYGHGKSLRGLAGSGAATFPSPVYSLPSVHEGNVIIDSITADGTVYFRYSDQHISLEPNENWENVTRIVEKYGSPDSSGCTAEYITTDRFYNAGILDKRNIS